MKIEILHNVFGSITVDEEGKISVRKNAGIAKYARFGTITGHGPLPDITRVPLT
jgi:hypothetical protein